MSTISTLNCRKAVWVPQKWLAGYFKDQVLPHLLPMMITESKDYSDINDTMTHLFVEMRGDKNHHAFLEVPTDRLNRFAATPRNATAQNHCPIDDVIRLYIADVFRSFFSLSIFQRTPWRWLAMPNITSTSELEEGVLDTMSKASSNAFMLNLCAYA